MDECKPLPTATNRRTRLRTKLRMELPTRNPMNSRLRYWLSTLGQGLILVHYEAQLEPFLTQKHTLNIPNIPYHPLSTPETTRNCTPCHTEGA